MVFFDSLRARTAGLCAALVRRPDSWLSAHGLLWLLAVLALAVVLYVLALIPFTPAISDIRKAKSDQPAQLVSSDGRLLAEYRWVNREWVPLSTIARPVVDALIADDQANRLAEAV